MTEIAPPMPPGVINAEALHQLLMLEEKLRGHPHMAATKAIVDRQLKAAEAAHAQAEAKFQAQVKAKEIADAEAKAQVAAKEQAYDAEKARREAIGANFVPPPLNPPPPMPQAHREVVDGLPGPAERKP
jgi:hypothetical protein